MLFALCGDYLVVDSYFQGQPTTISVVNDELLSNYVCMCVYSDF